MPSEFQSRLGTIVAEGIKTPVVTSTTANITLSGLQTINGVALSLNDRVLVKDQTDATENGIYLAKTSTWERAADMDYNDDIVNGCIILDTNTSIFWAMNVSGFWTEGVTEVTFTTAFAGTNLTGTPVDNQVAVWTNATTLEGTAGLTWDGSDLVVGGNIDLAGALSVTGNIYGDDTAGSLGVGAAGTGADGGNILFQGSAHASQPGDFFLRSGLNVVLAWDESSGHLAVQTGVGVKTEAVRFDSSQNTLVRGDMIFDSPAGIYTDANTGEISVSGGGAALNGGNIGLVGGSHASFAGDVYIRSGANKIFDWDESAGSLTLSTGTGAKTGAVAWNSSQHMIIAGEIMRSVNSGLARISGGDAADDGGSVLLYGSAHAIFPGDVFLRSGAQNFLLWDESVGGLTLATGVGAKTSAILVDASQNLQLLAGDMIIAADADIYTDGNAGFARMSGGGAANNGGGVLLYGGSHATFPGDVYLRSGANNFLSWDESIGQLLLSTGVGTKSNGMRINSSAEVDFYNLVTIEKSFAENTSCFEVKDSTNLSELTVVLNPTNGGFNSITQADDVLILSNGVINGSALTLAPWGSDAVGVRMDSSTDVLDLHGASGINLNHNTTFLANAIVEGSIYSPANDDSLSIAGGGGSANGGNILLAGASEATFPGDLFLRSGANNFLVWDESAGSLTISTGTGSKTAAVTINSSQTVTVAGTLQTQGAFLLQGTSAPASASATGTAGSIAIDGNYIYVCIAANTWKRAAISTW